MSIYKHCTVLFVRAQWNTDMHRAKKSQHLYPSCMHWNRNYCSTERQCNCYFELSCGRLSFPRAARSLWQSGQLWAGHWNKLHSTELEHCLQRAVSVQCSLALEVMTHLQQLPDSLQVVDQEQILLLWNPVQLFVHLYYQILQKDHCHCFIVGCSLPIESTSNNNAHLKCCMMCQSSSTENYNLFRNLGSKKKDFKYMVTCI